MEKDRKEEQPQKRQIIIETDGTNINIIKSESSALEMISIFSLLLNKLQNR